MRQKRGKTFVKYHGKLLKHSSFPLLFFVANIQCIYKEQRISCFHSNIDITENTTESGAKNRQEHENTTIHTPWDCLPVSLKLTSALSHNLQYH